MFRYELELEGLSVHRAVDRLRREGVAILSAHKIEKNGLKIVINANERKKAFTILQSSCYNIKKCRPAGALRLLHCAARAAGVIVGAAAVLPCVLFLQGRVLRIEVTGSGAYLEPEIRAVLSEKDVGYFSPMPAPNAVVPDILSLPRVHFCSVKGENGVLTVRVEVGDETSPLAAQSLLSPAAGKVEELTVLRGTPLVQVGDSVERGQEVVANYALRGEEREQCIVVARVRIAFSVSREYELDEERARAQAMLDFGELSDLHMTKTAAGWRVEGTGHAEGTMNFG